MRWKRHLFYILATGCFALLLCMTIAGQNKRRGNRLPPITPRGPANTQSNLQTIKLVRTLKLSTSSGLLGEGAVSVDGKLLALGDTTTKGSNDYAVKLYDAQTGQLKHMLTGHSRQLTSIAFSPDSTMVVSGSHEFITTNVLKGEARLWDTRTGALLQVFKGSSAPFVVAFSPDSETVAAGTNWGPCEIRLWDVHTGRLLRTLRGRGENISYVEFSADGQFIAGGNNGTINLWNINTGELKYTIANPTGSGFITFSPDSILLAGTDSTAYGSIRISLWDVKTGELLLTIDPSIGYARQGVDPGGTYGFIFFSLDGQKIFAMGDDSLRSWDVRAGNLERKAKLPRGIRIEQTGGRLPEGRLLSDGKTLITLDRDATARWWEVNK